jgi:hypothetical protein
MEAISEWAEGEVPFSFFDQPDSCKGAQFFQLPCHADLAFVI